MFQVYINKYMYSIVYTLELLLFIFAIVENVYTVTKCSHWRILGNYFTVFSSRLNRFCYIFRWQRFKSKSRSASKFDKQGDSGFKATKLIRSGVLQHLKRMSFSCQKQIFQIQNSANIVSLPVPSNLSPTQCQVELRRAFYCKRVAWTDGALVGNKLRLNLDTALMDSIGEPGKDHFLPQCLSLSNQCQKKSRNKRCTFNPSTLKPAELI